MKFVDFQGTGKLPAYSMPVNEAGLSMDEVQSLMLALCFTHQIVNQAISIPEPIYQADEWAKRGRNNFKAMLLVSLFLKMLTVNIEPRWVLFLSLNCGSGAAVVLVS